MLKSFWHASKNCTCSGFERCLSSYCHHQIIEMIQSCATYNDISWKSHIELEFLLENRKFSRAGNVRDFFEYHKIPEIKTPIDRCALPWSQTPTDHRQTDNFLRTCNCHLLFRNSQFIRESANKRTDRRTDRQTDGQTDATNCIISQLRGR